MRTSKSCSPATLLLLACALLPLSAAGQDVASLPAAERTAIAEAFSLAERLAPGLWQEWRAVPFAVLLVSGEQEFLIRHPRPPKDFAPAGVDLLLQEPVLVRKRVLPPNLLATFPLEGSPTVVMGEMQATGKHSTAWVMTLLHEHFHQLQYSQPGYYEKVNALGLARGDQTGMWMLNYPFPYDSSELNRAFEGMRDRLLEALHEPKPERLTAYREARGHFHGMLTPDDRTYLEFQLWQEGAARYMELEMAHAAASECAPGAAFRALPDAVSFAQQARLARESTLKELASSRLDESKRLAFYSLGAAEIMLLEAYEVPWRGRYFEHLFTLRPHFEP